MSQPSLSQRFKHLFTSEKVRHADVILQGFDDKTFADMKAITITESMCDAAAVTVNPEGVRSPQPWYETDAVNKQSPTWSKRYE